jgi:hypothetical protein
MSYLATNPITEKVALAKCVTFEATLTLALNTAPTVAITPPASASAMTLQFASGATTATGTLTANAYTGLTDMTTNPANPIFAVELLDGIAKEFIGLRGVVLTSSGANNASPGQEIFAAGAANGTVTTAGHLAIKATVGQTPIDATTGDTFSALAAAAGTVKVLISVWYV